MKTSTTTHTFMFAAVCLCALLFVTGCTASTSPTPGTSGETIPASTPAPPTGPQAGTTLALPGGLTLEEHALAGPATLEPLTFSPLDGTQAEIEARHADMRADRFPERLEAIDGLPAITAEWQGGTLTAVERTANPETQEIAVDLREQDNVIFTAPAGFPSPATALQALWTYDGHWALEILLATPDSWKGEVYLDGQLLNDQLGYEEAFGSQLLGGKLFYFYQRDGVIGINYDGQEASLGYSQVPHYQCCSASVLNPQQAQDMEAFFAERDGTWYYVELGLFN
jgi:hypothetical protein